MRRPALALVLCVLATPALAGRVVVHLEPSAPVGLSAGSAGTATLAFEVDPGYYVQANPAAADYLKPVLVEVSNGCGVVVGAPVYPPGRPHRIEGAEADLSIYAGRFEVRVPLTAGRESLPVPCALRGTLRYQACDSRTCLPPARIPLTLPLKAAARR